MPYLRGQDICSLATRFGFPIVNKEDDLGCKSKCAEDLSNGNYDSVITKLRTLMEEIFLYVLENEKVNVKMNGDLTQYYGKIKEKYGLNQSSDIDNRIN